MFLRAIAIWLGIMVVAIVNGAFRGVVLVPRLGELAGRFISTLMLCAFILLIAVLSIGWIGPADVGQAWLVGLMWLGLTLAFEFLAGHYLFGDPWEKLLADYNILRGRIWVLVPITTLLAPWLALSVRGPAPVAHPAGTSQVGSAEQPSSAKSFPSKEQIKLPDRWSLAQGQPGGRPIFVRYIPAARDLCGHPDYPHQVGVAVPFNHSDKNGLPSHGDLEALNGIEDRIVKALTVRNESLFVGVITSDGMREFVLYTSNPEAVERKFKELQKSVRSHELQLMIQPDKDWQTYKQFFCP